MEFRQFRPSSFIISPALQDDTSVYMAMGIPKMVLLGLRVEPNGSQAWCLLAGGSLDRMTTEKRRV